MDQAQYLVLPKMASNGEAGDNNNDSKDISSSPHFLFGPKSGPSLSLVSF